MLQVTAENLLREELADQGIIPCFWPAFSPVLNPVEEVWNQMKDYIAKHFPENLSYDDLRKAVRET